MKICCACGCGVRFENLDKKGRPRTFLWGHNNRGDKKVNWKGNAVSYRGLHHWVCRKLGTPCCCELCGTTENRKYHWINKSGEYKRELSDWLRACVPCHSRYDRSRGAI